jgi:hypothetical protein
MADKPVILDADELWKEQRKQDKKNNPYTPLAKKFRDIDTPAMQRKAKEYELKAEAWMKQRELQRSGVPDEDIQSIGEFAWGATKGAFATGLDFLARGLYATAGAAEETLKWIAPEGTREHAAIAKIGQDMADAFSGKWGDPRLAGSLGGALTVGMYSAKQQFWDAPEEKRASLTDLSERVQASVHSGTLPLMVGKRVFNEVFSGLGPLEGEKEGFGDVLRSIGVKDSGEMSDILKAKFGDDHLTIPNPLAPGNIEIGYSDTGEQWYNFERHGVLDPYAVDVMTTPADVFLDPGTYLTMGSSGIVRALGRPLSKVGIKRLGVLMKEIEQADKLRLAAAVAREDAELLAKVEAEIARKGVRTRASEIILQEARRDSSLLRPRGEIRWMGQQIGSLGKTPTKATIPARIIQSEAVKNSVRRFSRALEDGMTAPAGSLQRNLVRETLEAVAARARKITDTIAPELTDIDDWLHVVAEANGTVVAATERVDNNLRGMGRLKRHQNDQMLDALEGQYANLPDGADARMRELAALNDEIGAVADELGQEIALGVDRTALHDISMLMETEGDRARAFHKRLRNRIKSADAEAEMEAVARASERNMDLVDELGIVNPEDLMAVPKDVTAKKVYRTEVFFKNKQKHLLRYTEKLAELFPELESNKLSKMIEDLLSGNLKNIRTSNPRLQGWVDEMLKLANDEPQKFAQRMQRLKNMEADRAHQLISLGDRGALITPMHRRDLVSLLEEMRAGDSSLPKLKPITNAKEHVFRRAQVAHNKRALEFITRRAWQMSKDDGFNRRLIERHLTSVGELEQLPGVNRAKVDDAIDGYVKTQLNELGQERIFMEDGVWYKRVKGGKGEPVRDDVWKAIEGLNKEETQLFFRQWLLGDGAFQNLPMHQADGLLSRRLYSAMNMIGEIDDWAPSQKALNWSEMTQEDKLLRRWADDALKMREALGKKGLSIDDMFPRTSVGSILRFNKDRIKPFRHIKRTSMRSKGEKGGIRTWKYDLAGSRTGEQIFLPESLHRQMERLVDAGLGNPEVGKLLRGWDIFQNFMKLGLTAVGGFPAFQLRNMYSNVAFGFTGAHVGLLNARSWNLARKWAWQNTDPSIAITPWGHRNAMRMRVMHDIVLQPEGYTGDLMDVARAVHKHYKNGRKQLQSLADNPKALRKEAQGIFDDLNQVVVTDDFGREFTQAEVLREIKTQGVDVNPRLLAELTGETERFHSKKWSEVPKDIRDKIVDKFLRSNAFFEQWSRQQLFLTGLKNGLGPAEAGRLARKWLLDYQALSPVEQRVMKRIFPFYTFYRKTVPLMVESMFTRYGPMSVQAKLITQHDAHDPEVSFGAEPGRRIVVRKDGKGYVMGGVDLPINSLKFLDILSGFIPSDDPAMKEARKEGWHQLATMIHPVIQGMIESGSDYEMFAMRSRDQKRLNALGKAMEKLGATQEGGWFVKKKNRKGQINYYFDKTMLVNLTNAAGISRLLANVDRIEESITEMSDGHFDRLFRWATGLNLIEPYKARGDLSQTHQITASDRNVERLVRFIRAMDDEARRRGMAYEYRRTVTMPPTRRGEYKEHPVPEETQIAIPDLD